MRIIPGRKVDVYEVEMAGHVKEHFYFEPGPCQCGSMKDAVSFEFDNDCGWVIPFSELEAMYLIAIKARGKALGGE